MDKGQLTTDKLGLLIPNDELKRLLKEDAEKKEPEFKAYCKSDKTLFEKNARLWQSRWRKKTLKREKMGYDKNPGKEWGSLLLEADAKAGYNFYEGFGIREAVENDHPRADPDRKFNDVNNIWQNLLRSQHIPFNMFIPLYEGKGKDNKYFINIINDILEKKIIDNSDKKKNRMINKIEDFKIEHKPPKKEKRKYLNDDTSFDTYIEYTSIDDRRCIIGIEMKYTEGCSFAYSTKSYEKYKKVTNDSGAYEKCFEDLEKNFKDKKYNQIWRNHLLGESILLKDKEDKEKDEDKKFKEFISITIYPEGNEHIGGNERIRKATDFAKFLNEENKYKCLFITYEELFKLFKNHCPNEQYKHWIDWMEKRYIVNFKDYPL